MFPQFWPTPKTSLTALVLTFEGMFVRVGSHVNGEPLLGVSGEAEGCEANGTSRTILQDLFFVGMTRELMVYLEFPRMEDPLTVETTKGLDTVETDEGFLEFEM
jgi:hypothetical protein